MYLNKNKPVNGPSRTHKKMSVKCLALALVIFAALLMPTTALFAADPAPNPTVEQVPDDCRSINNDGATNHVLPDSFSVSKCLSTKAQRDSKFLPKADNPAANQAGSSAPTDSSMSIKSVLVDVIDVFIKVIATVALIVFIIGAVMTIVSAGNDDILGKGKNAMLYSLIGLAIAMVSFIIVSAVQSLFFNN